MVRQRVPETDEGIQDHITVHDYNEMLRVHRDKGWMETKEILRSGIDHGHCVEIGPGPGYLGLEWLKNTENTTLTGLEISAAMREMATQNAAEYGLEDRWSVTEGNAMNMPFEDASIDAVISNGSLHEWERPKEVFNEIHRILRLGGRYFISDLRRDMFFALRWFLWVATKPKSIRPGLISSMNAAYTPSELEALLSKTRIHRATVGSGLLDNMISGTRT